MNEKLCFGAITCLLIVTLTGCGNAGNNANAGNAAGFIGNRIGNGVGNGQAWNHSPDTPDTTLRGNTDDVRTHSIVFDASQRTVDIRIGAGPTPAINNGFYPNRPPSGGLRENVGRVVVPRGWTVNVFTDNAPTRTLSIVPYPPSGIGTDASGGAGVGRRMGTYTNQGVTRPSPHPGTSFVARDPGDYAIVQLNRGRPNQVLEVITVAASSRLPTITTIQPFRSR